MLHEKWFRSIRLQAHRSNSCSRADHVCVEWHISGDFLFFSFYQHYWFTFHSKSPREISPNRVFYSAMIRKPPAKTQITTHQRRLVCEPYEFHPPLRCPPKSSLMIGLPNIPSLQELPKRPTDWKTATWPVARTLISPLHTCPCNKPTSAKLDNANHHSRILIRIKDAYVQENCKTNGGRYWRLFNPSGI